MHPDLPLDQILIGDCRELVKTLPDESVHCVVTSPPYWGLRSYGTDPQVWQNGHEPCQEHQWGDVERVKKSGGTNGLPYELNKWIDASSNTCSVCGAWRGELGLEPTPELYVEHLTQIFREVRRVLRDDGTIWVNLGDSYAAGKQGRDDGGQDGGNFHGQPKHSETKPMARKAPTGLKPKDLVGIPWMVAFALRADGWYLRSDIIWAKPNPMPESVTDRPTKAHEYIFLLSKSQHYYYDADAVREPMAESSIDRVRTDKFGGSKYSGRVSERKLPQVGGSKTTPVHHSAGSIYTGSKDGGRNRRTVWTVATHPFKGAHFATFPPKLIEPCILAGCPQGGVVLDPFIGSGTTASVCISLARHYIGFDLNPAYVEGIAQDRADGTPPPLFVI